MAKKIKDENGNVYIQKKPFYKRWWFIAFIVLVVIGVFGNMGGNDGTSSSSSSKSSDNSTTKVSSDDVTTEDSTTTASSVAETTDKEKVYALGELVNVGDVAYTLNSFSTASNVGGEFGENAQGIYLLINVSVTNNGSEALTVSDDFFKLYRGKTEYSSDSTASVYADEGDSFFYNEVNPGNTVTGVVVFDVPQEVANDVANLQLQVQTGYWGTETARIYLQ